MNRRIFLAGSAALAAMLPGRAMASGWIDYQDGLIGTLQAEGRVVLADFWASWCSTCRTQERILDGLRAENPAYDAAISFVRVDWDIYNGHQIRHDLGVPRRSTLVLLQGNTIHGRLVADTRPDNIRALLDQGLGLA